MESIYCRFIPNQRIVSYNELLLKLVKQSWILYSCTSKFPEKILFENLRMKINKNFLFENQKLILFLTTREINSKNSQWKKNVYIYIYVI